jgi:hypothetical protein
MSGGRALVAMLAIASVLAVGCSRAVEGHPVAAKGAGSPDDSQCTKVDAPLTTVPAAPGAPDDSEPTMRVPQPEGWDRITKMDSEMIRFTMGNRALGVTGFAASAVVTIESHPGELDASSFFDEARDALASSFGTVDVDYTDGTVCGLPAQTIHYVLPQGGALKQEVPATAVMVVVFTGRKTYGVVLTIQSPVPDDPDYQRDAELITTGFQVLAPDSGHR